MSNQEIEKKEAVRQAIIRAVPSVMDLNFGCRVKDSTGEWILIDDDGDQFICWNGTSYHGLLKLSLKIIGRPIQLQDVLTAIDKVDSNYCLSFEGQFVEYDAENGNMNLSGVWWKPSEDFDHQPEPCINFLWELLFG